MARVKFTNSKFHSTKNEISSESETDFDHLLEEDFLIKEKKIPAMKHKKKRPRIVR